MVMRVRVCIDTDCIVHQIERRRMERKRISFQRSVRIGDGKERKKMKKKKSVTDACAYTQFQVEKSLRRRKKKKRTTAERLLALQAHDNSCTPLPHQCPCGQRFMNSCVKGAEVPTPSVIIQQDLNYPREKGE